jgi:hypothetical protein
MEGGRILTFDVEQAMADVNRIAWQIESRG